MSWRSRWWRVLASLAIAVALVAPANAPAAADEDATVSFVGSGWGHGVGLSQYGAYGQSKEGYTVDQIIGHYYQGSSIGTMGEDGLDPKENLWVNLEKDRSSLLLIAEEIGYLDPPPLADVTVTRGDDTWLLGVNDKLQIEWNSGDGTCALEIQDFDGTTIETPGPGPCNVDITWDGWEEKPSRKIGIDGCFNWDWNAVPQSINRPCEYARGELHLRSGPGGMDLSVEIDIDDYVLGISEMPYYWGLAERDGLEALKAQALAARSYARELQILRPPPGDNLCGAWCDVRDTTVDQRYVGWGHVGLGIDEWIEAVDSTAGQVITHPDAPNGNVVRSYYSSSSGGATESVHEVWSSFGTPISYLMSVDDHWAKLPEVNNPYDSWTVTKDAAFVAAKVGLDTLTGAIVTETHTSGSAKRVLFTGLDNGVATEVYKTGVWVDQNMGLRSIYFDVQYGEIELPPFDDIEGSVHYDDIVYIAELGITKGCNPPSNTNYCPKGTVTRGEMAAFLVRTFGLTDDGNTDWFTDDDSSIFEGDINRLRQAGITSGCNADGTKFCPKAPVTRGEMAAFLVRGFGYTNPGSGDWFDDDDDSMFEGDIDRLRQAGVTFGCNPPDNTNFCPDDSVRRDQMASFLTRALIGDS
ncbi:MAG: S-layer homology domain-containing protein [Acidimicrobiia bacterium]|nr:S-layer homology domain-containing protein [Acidimicrobiia bacterium]